MANTGKQSPLGINVLGAYLNSTGLTINPITLLYIGSSKTNATYQFGSIINQTCLRLLTWAINDGWYRGPDNGNATLSNSTYNNLISIGSTTLPALGNAKPPSYATDDPSGVWSSLNYSATTGYAISGNVDQGQTASWLPYDTSNPNASITQWGYLRLHALQGWNEFNWNGTSVTQANPEYKEFCSSFLTGSSWVNYNNQVVISANESDYFLDGTYSNMNDLVSADVLGVSLSAIDFGNDLINLGNTLNLSRIDAFGLPSVLLETLGQNNAVSSELSLALLASGLSPSEISQLTTGSAPFVTIDQEQKIYGAFLVIIGDNLRAILSSLRCTTLGLNSLADLLNVKKLFPISYSSLTVPRYNSELGLPTNSKTYYLIYSNGGINSSLTTNSMNSYVGIQTPGGQPPIYDTTQNPTNYSPQIGFGSYLKGIIPNDQAIAAGAFSFTMRQIRNIEQVDFNRFAKAVQSMENMEGLDLINGTSKPTNQQLLNDANVIMALGSGPKGMFTYSDLYGCMSGLPYPWKLIKQRINELETLKLYNIYQQLYLAVTWQPATVSVQYSSYTVGPDTYYTVTGITVTNPGGGYGRGQAINPIITVSDGTAAVGIIDTNDLNAGSNGTGTYGRVLYATITSAGIDSTSIPTATIETPPVFTLPISNNGSVSSSGVNAPAGTDGWGTVMNDVVQAYISQANTEISFINFNNSYASSHLRMYWKNLGSQLTIEQRTRAMAIPPVSIPKDEFDNPYPTTIQTFVDTIPSLSLDTAPHMSVQTLENITNMDLVGGQSLIAMMRQERNQARLLDTGIQLDNNISDELSSPDLKTWTTNGTVGGAKNGYGIESPNGTEYTIPAWPGNMRNGVEISPIPSGYYTFNPRNLTGEYINTSGIGQGDITTILEGYENPTAGPLIALGPELLLPNYDDIIIKPASELDPTNLPSQLDTKYISSTVLPSKSTISAAIDQVVECNCACWVN